MRALLSNLRDVCSGRVLALNLLALLTASSLSWFVYVPSLHILAVAVCRALFPWFTWQEPYWEIAVHLQAAAIWWALPSLALTTFLVTRALARQVVRAWRGPSQAGRTRIALRLAHAGLAIAVAPSIAAFVGLAAVPVFAFGPGYYTTPGRHLQRGSCSHCHSPYRPFHFFRPAHQWETTVHRMRTLEGAPIDEGEQARIARYLSSRCSYTDAWLFQARCLQCHDRGAIESSPRTAGEYEQIITRVARISPYAYRPDWTRQLHRYAAEELAVEDPDGNQSVKVLFEDRCGHCHELGMASPRTGEDTVRRMGAKVPGAITEAEQRSILQYVATLADDTAARAALFPHDQPVEVSR